MIDHLYASHQFSIKVMCRLFQVSRFSYYAFKSHQPSQRDQENKLLKKEIMISYLASSKRYGAPKIHKDLLEKGYQISEKRVQKLMTELNIRLPVLGFKGAEAHQLDPVSGSQRSGYGLQGGGQSLLRILLGEAGPLGHGGNQFGFVHGTLPLSWVIAATKARLKNLPYFIPVYKRKFTCPGKISEFAGALQFSPPWAAAYSRRT